MLSFFSNKYFVAIVIPLLLIFCGAIIKKLVRGSIWERKDFYFGVELTLTSLGAALLNLYDLSGLVKGNPSELGMDIFLKFGITAGYIAVSFPILLVLVSLHQDWENRTGNPGGQVKRLSVLSNLIGVLMFACFVLLVKGV